MWWDRWSLWQCEQGCSCAETSARWQRLDAALHRRQGPAQVRLQLLELLHRVRFGVPDDLVRLGLGVADRLLRLALGPVHDLVLLHRRLGTLVGLAHDARGLGV